MPVENGGALATALKRMMADPGLRARYAMCAGEQAPDLGTDAVMPLWENAVTRYVRDIR